jgi:hypothetical protein
MILSHKHKFIFFKTRKTAGTSVEIALSEICGPDDVITPLMRRDERLRTVRGKQNWVVPEEMRPWWSKIALKLGRNAHQAGVEFFHHIPASRVKRLVPTEVWNGYRKVSIERNPWDREVSFYFFRHKDSATRPSFAEYLTKDHQPIRNYDIYTADGRPADTIFRYENLASELDAFLAGLGIEERPVLKNAKGAFRPTESRDYRSFYTPQLRDRVAKLYAREIALFGYEF